MADQVSINIRQADALARITAACAQLAHAADIAPPELAITHRVPGIAVALLEETLADFLEGAAGKLAKRKVTAKAG